MANFQDLPAFETLLNCPICFDPFETPKFLRCGHTFCLTCLEKLSKPASKEIWCPMCKHKTWKHAKGVSKLPNDFRISQIRDALGEAAYQVVLPTEPDADTGGRCGSCSLLTTVVRCLQCHKDLCVKCLIKHNKQRKTVYHTILRLRDVPTCYDHGKDCAHWCGKCQRFACTECMTKKCKGHSCSDIGQVVRQIIEAGNLKHIWENAGRILSGFDDILTKVNEKTSSIDQAMQTRVDILIRNITRDYELLRNELNNTKNDVLEKMNISHVTAFELRQKIAPFVDIKPDDLGKGIPAGLLHSLWIDPQTVCQPDELHNTASNILTLQYNCDTSSHMSLLGNITDTTKDVTTNHKLDNSFSNSTAKNVNTNIQSKNEASIDTIGNVTSDLGDNGEDPTGAVRDISTNTQSHGGTTEEGNGSYLLPLSHRESADHVSTAASWDVITHPRGDESSINTVRNVTASLQGEESRDSVRDLTDNPRGNSTSQGMIINPRRNRDVTIVTSVAQGIDESSFYMLDDVSRNVNTDDESAVTMGNYNVSTHVQHGGISTGTFGNSSPHEQDNNETAFRTAVFCLLAMIAVFFACMVANKRPLFEYYKR